ncbi:hypothetical protein KFK09_016612 [Dendrobium nobile]|uniref:Uncharacterized protein n=1 Tax=Dendrobium nobile TaxID=94219 RepID=A0A8T3AZV4_DENNO|nr:hypothetical protein KFK09_016612 [Dendrobium nobile]
MLKQIFRSGSKTAANNRCKKVQISSSVGEIAAVARGGELRRKDFSGDFIFGTASSAYQYFLRVVVASD